MGILLGAWWPLSNHLATYLSLWPLDENHWVWILRTLVIIWFTTVVTHLHWGHLCTLTNCWPPPPPSSSSLWVRAARAPSWGKPWCQSPPAPLTTRRSRAPILHCTRLTMCTLCTMCTQATMCTVHCAPDQEYNAPPLQWTVLYTALFQKWYCTVCCF